jgi:hypothetical protein
MVLVSYAAMRGGERAPPKAATWFAEADHGGAGPPVRNGPRIRLGDDGATSARAVVVSSLFFILLAASLLFGGHAAIDPLLRSAIAARDNAATGDFVSAMPDGKFCRHRSFDNATSEIIEGAVERCPDDMVREHFRNTVGGFTWGEH